MATPERTEVIGFEPFFREWYPRLVVLGVTMTGRRPVAQEIAQEALLRAHQRWDEVSGYDAPGLWVRRVAVNLLIDHLRSAGRERRAVAMVGARERGDASSTEPAVAEWTALMGGLTERQRAVVTLFYVDDQSVDAIADLMKIAPGTVKTQLFKAREKMRARLDEEEWS